MGPGTFPNGGSSHVTSTSQLKSSFINTNISSIIGSLYSNAIDGNA